MHCIQEVIPSEFEKIDYFLSNAMEQVREYISNEDDIFDIRLIISELVYNGAMHGNHWNPEKHIFLNINLSSNDISICVRDEGEGIDPSHNIEAQTHLECNGRGLVIVEALCDQMNCVGNEIIVRKSI